MTYDANCRAGKSIYEPVSGHDLCIGIAPNEINRFTAKIWASLMRVWNASLGRAYRLVTYASAYAGGCTTRA